MVGGGRDGGGLEVVGAEALGQMAEHRDAEAFPSADAEGWLKRGAVGELVGGVKLRVAIEAAGSPAVFGCGGVAIGAGGGELGTGDGGGAVDGVLVLHGEGQDPPEFAVIEVIGEGATEVLGFFVGDTVGAEAAGDVLGGEALARLQEGVRGPFVEGPVGADGSAGTDLGLIVHQVEEDAGFGIGGPAASDVLGEVAPEGAGISGNGLYVGILIVVLFVFVGSEDGRWEAS